MVWDDVRAGVLAEGSREDAVSGYTGKDSGTKDCLELWPVKVLIPEDIKLAPRELTVPERARSDERFACTDPDEGVLGAGLNVGLEEAVTEVGLAMTDLDRKLEGVGSDTEGVEVDVGELEARGSGGGGEGDDRHCKLI